jgi:diadenosine tetraphosphate (Ap4A) HIT family hydrolase
MKYTTGLQKSARKAGHGKMANEWYNKICKSLTKCPFCDLKEKYIIAEQDKVVLSANLFPYIDYMLIIIPRRHIEKFSELNDKEWAAVQELYDLAIKLLKESCKIENTNFLYREGPKSGKSLGHLHFQILPYEDGLLNWNYREISVPPLDVTRKLRKVKKGIGRSKD